MPSGFFNAGAYSDITQISVALQYESYSGYIAKYAALNMQHETGYTLLYYDNKHAKSYY